MLVQKVLPLPKSLPIRYDPNIDQLLEILLPYPGLYEQKLAEHFIDVLIYDNEISDNVGFYKIVNAVGLDTFLYYDLPYEVAKASVGNIVEYIITLLDQEFYVTFLCDTFWVNNYISYQKEHKEHPPFLYGYDREQQVFFAQDYFDFRSLGKQTISFADIQQSYCKGEFICYSGEHALLNACILWSKKLVNRQAGSINFSVIKQKLENFLNNYPYTNSEGLYCGIQFFDLLIQRYQKNPRNISLKHCHFIYAHMQFMLYRAEVLQKYRVAQSSLYAPLIASLQQLLSEVRLLEMRLLKCQITSSELTLDYGEKLKDVKARYANVIESIIHLIT